MKKPVFAKLVANIRKIQWHYLFAGALVAVLLWQVALAGISLTSNTCLVCHEMRDQTASLAKSTHAGINCMHCHNDEIILSLLSLQLRSTSNGLAHLRLKSKPVKPAQITDLTCLKCHAQILKGKATSKGVTVSHKEITAAGWECVNCHGGIAHEPKGKVRTIAMMKDCMRCHDGASASDDCGLCHAKDRALNRNAGQIPLSVIHNKNWKATHGMGDMHSCNDCHTDGFCGECHKARLPHPDNWSLIHSAYGADTSECYKCHNESYCKGCHSVDMPHPDDFLPNHKQVTDEHGIDTCWSCHTKESCEGCHMRAAHPKVPRF